jgi:RNA polymerase sigma-70 factor (ECF subfamily)
MSSQKRAARTTEEIARCFRAFARGDNAAFLELYEELNPRLGIFAEKNFRLPHQMAEDLLQEMWERLLNERTDRRLSHVKNPRAFLFEMLRNLTIDYLRKKKDTEEIEAAEGIGYRGATDENVPFGGLHELILAEFERLSEDHREILILNLYSGYDLGEAAEVLGISRDAAWARASRARTELRKQVLSRAEQAGINLSKLKEILPN